MDVLECHPKEFDLLDLFAASEIRIVNQAFNLNSNFKQSTTKIRIEFSVDRTLNTKSCQSITLIFYCFIGMHISY